MRFVTITKTYVYVLYFSLVDTTQRCSLDVSQRGDSSLPWEVFAGLRFCGVVSEKGVGGFNVTLFRALVMKYHSHHPRTRRKGLKEQNHGAAIAEEWGVMEPD